MCWSSLNRATLTASPMFQGKNRNVEEQFEGLCEGWDESIPFVLACELYIRLSNGVSLV